MVLGEPMTIHIPAREHPGPPDEQVIGSPSTAAAEDGPGVRHKEESPTQVGGRLGLSRQRLYQLRNPDIARASHALQRALKRGRISRSTCCEKCGTTEAPIHGHHPDYTLRLDVTWLCIECHRDLHKAIQRERRRQQSLYRRMIAGMTYHTAVLDWNQVNEIRCRYKAGGITQTALAQQYRVSQPTINELIHGKTWQMPEL